MYETFYGLSGKPFQLNPDPLFYFGSRQHRRAMSYLEYGLHQNEGFIVITGEIGAGKTTLVRNLFAKLSSNQVIAAHLVSTQLDADDMLRMVAAAFGIPTKQIDKSELLLKLEAFLVSVAQQGKRCLLVVDEAQNLTQRAVEELRMLSNFQLETHALLQSFLIGQPEFRNTLHGPAMEQLRQRVIAACHIGPLGEEETSGYIRHRLGCVGWKENSPSFSMGALEAIYQASGGIPRRINSICDRLLWYGYLADKKSFTQDDISEVAEEMIDETQSKNTPTKVMPLHNTRNEPSRLPGGQDASLTLTEIGAFDLHEGNSFSGTESLENQILRLDSGIRRLDVTLLRIERNNLASTALFRKFMDWIKSREAGHNDAA